MGEDFPGTSSPSRRTEEQMVGGIPDQRLAHVARHQRRGPVVNHPVLEVLKDPHDRLKAFRGRLVLGDAVVVVLLWIVDNRAARLLVGQELDPTVVAGCRVMLVVRGAGNDVGGQRARALANREDLVGASHGLSTEGSAQGFTNRVLEAVYVEAAASGQQGSAVGLDPSRLPSHLLRGTTLVVEHENVGVLDSDVDVAVTPDVRVVFV